MLGNWSQKIYIKMLKWKTRTVWIGKAFFNISISYLLQFPFSIPIFIRGLSLLLSDFFFVIFVHLWCESSRLIQTANIQTQEPWPQKGHLNQMLKCTEVIALDYKCFAKTVDCWKHVSEHKKREKWYQYQHHKINSQALSSVTQVSLTAFHVNTKASLYR